MRSSAALALVALLYPSLALAFPFGGQASTVVPCYNTAIFARLGPPRGGDYIWTPATKTYQFGPPSFAGQWLLGLASAPYYCVVSIEPVIVWAGIAIDMMGSSGGALGSVNRLLTGSAPTTAAPPATSQYKTPNTSSNPSSPTTIGHVVVSEVFANVDSTHGTRSLDQWIELYNGSASAVDISNWKIRNVSTETALPGGNTLASGQFAVIVAASTTPSFWTIPTNAKVITLGGTIAGGLSILSDAVLLKDGNGTLVDSVSWGSNTSAFNPAATAPATGNPLWRKTLSQDTNTASDWSSSGLPTPGR